MRDFIAQILAYLNRTTQSGAFEAQEVLLGKNALVLCMVRLMGWLKQRAVTGSAEKMVLTPDRFVVDRKLLEWLQADSRMSTLFACSGDTLDFRIPESEQQEILAYVDAHYAPVLNDS